MSRTAPVEEVIKDGENGVELRLQAPEQNGVQVTKVMQPSEWQQGYADFNREQLALLAQARGDAEVSR